MIRKQLTVASMVAATASHTAMFAGFNAMNNDSHTTKLNFNKSPDRIKLFALLIVETFSFLKQLTYVKSSFWIMLLYILS
jgi:hypothetical protein